MGAAHIPRVWICIHPSVNPACCADYVLFLLCRGVHAIIPRALDRRGAWHSPRRPRARRDVQLAGPGCLRGRSHSWRFGGNRPASWCEILIPSQAFALCPRSPEAIFRYVNLLTSVGRMDDASRVATAAQSLEPDNHQLEDLVAQVRRQKQAQKKWTASTPGCFLAASAK